MRRQEAEYYADQIEISVKRVTVTGIIEFELGYIMKLKFSMFRRDHELTLEELEEIRVRTDGSRIEQDGDKLFVLNID